MRDTRSLAPLAGAAILALTLAACGGGGSDTTPAISVTSVKVMGDSLADSGTFGYKFTVQGANSKIYPEIIAAQYGVAPLCNFYTATSATTFVPNPTKSGCTNYAIGGGRINNFTAPTSPVSIIQQLKNASATSNYAAGDMLIIDGGGNDSADLVGAFLSASTDGGASYAALLQTELPAATVGAAVAGGQAGLEAVGATYMTALADVFYSTIKASALDKGAQRVVILNSPDVTQTPRLQMALAGVAAASGGGATGAAVSAHFLSVFKTWISAFNTELAAKVAGNTNVVLVDFYSSFDDEVANPAQYGLQNATLPACPISGTSGGLPTYDFPTCTDVALSAMTPHAGATGGADWWKTFAFSDSFHPTPYGHQLLSQLISRALAQAGWL
jgi:outer membrane lipase/esterase